VRQGCASWHLDTANNLSICKNVSLSFLHGRRRGIYEGKLYRVLGRCCYCRVILGLAESETLMRVAGATGGVPVLVCNPAINLLDRGYRYS